MGQMCYLRVGQGYTGGPGTYTQLKDIDGPTALRSHRITKKAMSAIQAKKLRTVMDPAWDGNLEDCFETVINDECHTLKSLSADVSVTVQWLKPQEKYIIISATTIPKGIDDWIGYMPFVQSEDADFWWSPRYVEYIRATIEASIRNNEVE